MSSQTYPFVIITVQPYWAGDVGVFPSFGTVTESKMKNYFLNVVSTFILEFIRDFIEDDREMEYLKCEEDITKFWNEFYKQEGCIAHLDNHPWEAYIFKNGGWIKETPSNKSIWKYINEHQNELLVEIYENA
jgi:hypothetical protein